ncbi:hypothetical protein AB0L71_27615 [Streptomyces sp. NPDC052052]|uniref:hypothetical protein n=1 Tax=Streptomyces sp. NPDC052052 TaxID=3154756 RepID=UPI00343D30E5
MARPAAPAALIREWKPGAPAAVVEVLANYNDKILRRAARNVASHLAATDMANDIHNNRIDHTQHDNEICGKKGYGRRPNPVVIAAEPDTSHHTLRPGGDRQVLEAGWHKLALSNHPDAVAAIEVVVGREPDLPPFGALAEVPVRCGAISERRTRRLTMCDPTAAHVILAQSKKAEAFFINPLTDMPVMHTPDHGGKRDWRFFAPPSLPAGDAELASVVLHHTVWVTTSDGHVHPVHTSRAPVVGQRIRRGPAMPRRSSTRSWTASEPPQPREHWKAPKGLTALLNEDHKQGTELTRSTLLHARMTPPRTH